MLFLVFCVAASGKHAKLDLSRLIIVGDSLSAGVQNIGLVDYQQQTGYVAVLARQAGIYKDLLMPLVASPGMPPVIGILQAGPIPVIGVQSLANLKYDLTHPRLTPQPCPPGNPTCQPTNLSVPGFTVEQALEFRPSTDPAAPGPEQWGNIVLGSAPFVNGSPRPTMIEQAVMQNPTTTLVWLGNNDALIGSMVGIPQQITPPARFEELFGTILDQLCKKDPKSGNCTSSTSLITATIPDVTAIPFFTPVDEIAELFGVSTRTLMSKTGLQNGDFVRRSALPVIQKIVNGETSGPLEGNCPSPIYALPVAEVPCIFRAADVAFVQANINAYNDAIARQSAAHDAFVLDTHGLLETLRDKGYKIRNVRLTTSYLGGIFSADGIHPSATGYAIVANFIIDALNKEFKLKIPEASVEDVWNSDCFRAYPYACFQ